jgi:AcrR family transcriptional regulator
MPKITPLADHQALSPRKTPLQSRATATRDAILQAATQIITREGLAAFNTNRVAEVAGISVGSLYQYYPNKAALLTALSIEKHAQLLAKMQAASLQAVRQQNKRTDPEQNHLNLEKAVDKLLILVLDHHFENPELARALDYAERALAPSDEVLSQNKLIVASLTEMLSHFRQQIKGDLRFAALDVQTIVRAMIDGAESRGEINSSALRKRIRRAVLGYLRTP